MGPDPSPALVARETGGDVGRDVVVAIEHRVLLHQHQVAPVLLDQDVRIGEGDAAEPYGSGIRVLLTGDHPQQSRLARAGRAGDAEHLARRHGQADVRQHRATVVRLHHPLDARGRRPLVASRRPIRRRAPVPPTDPRSARTRPRHAPAASGQSCTQMITNAANEAASAITGPMVNSQTLTNPTSVDDQHRQRAGPTELAVPRSPRRRTRPRAPWRAAGRSRRRWRPVRPRRSSRIMPAMLTKPVSAPRAVRRFLSIACSSSPRARPPSES